MLSTKQVVGSMIFGQIYAMTSGETALLIFATLPLLMDFAIRSKDLHPTY
jgi:hypothetical protein